MKKLLLCFLMLIFFSQTGSAEPITVSTGAGYKNMVEELAAAYKKEGHTILEMYGGNIGQIAMQIRQGSGVTVLISDKQTLIDIPHGVPFDAFEPLGKTVLVLAWRKGLQLDNPKDLTRKDILSVCLPDAKAAIFGRAAVRYLETSGIGAKISNKLCIVSTVPQVFSYLTTGEMDTGFINRVMLINGRDKLGGWIELNEGYLPLEMTAAIVKGHAEDSQVQNFISFLHSREGKRILAKYGIR